MKKENISDALNNIDFDMVEDVYENTKEKKRKQKSLWLKWGRLQLAFALWLVSFSELQLAFFQAK